MEIEDLSLLNVNIITIFSLRRNLNDISSDQAVTFCEWIKYGIKVTISSDNSEQCQK